MIYCGTLRCGSFVVHRNLLKSLGRFPQVEGGDGELQDQREDLGKLYHGKCDENASLTNEGQEFL